MTELPAMIDHHLGNAGGQADRTAEARTALLKAVNGDSLGTMISAALELRRQGRIDRAIALLTRANRQQLDAIEDIQRTVNELSNNPNPTVVFAKYRQFQPFEMGMENADDVLSLIDAAEAKADGSATGLRTRLHELEHDKQAETERLEFFERRFADGSEAETIEQARTAIQAMDEAIAALKASLLSAVMSAVTDFLAATKQPAASTRHDLSRWLYVLVTSPTRTRHATDVDVDA